MWAKQKELQDIFSIGATTCSKVCRCIDKHLDRYGEFAKDGSRYGVLAFADANKYRIRLNRGEEVPPFDPEEISKHLFEKDIQDVRDAFESGEIAMKEKIFDQIDGYFAHTTIPKDIEPVRLTSLIKQAVLSMIITTEVTT